MFEKIYGSNKHEVILKGHWKAILEGAPGEIKQRVEGDNIVTTAGKDFIASFLYSAVVAPSTFTMQYVGIGTDTTAEDAGQTALGIEAGRTTGTVSYVSGGIYQVTATFTSGVGTGAIVEYGLFSSSSAGTMLNRDVEAVINKGVNDTLTVICQLTLS